MSQYPVVTLYAQKAEAVKRFHPWIFSGAIQRKENTVTENALVQVQDEKGQFLAVGYYSIGSIAVRIVSFKPIESIDQLWLDKIQSAYNLRKSIGLVDNKETNVYRLFNAEGDGVPGLIIDYYNGTCVLQAHSMFVHKNRFIITEALQKVLGSSLKAVYDKSEAVLERKEKSTVAAQYILGEKSTNEVMEHGNKFLVDWETGQKTGFFIDQRENRKLLAQYSKGRKVLNTFSYTGGFSVYAAQAGATLVHSVDSSVKAIELAVQNVQLNNIPEGIHEAAAEDVFDFMKRSPNNFYDVIVLDPPAFAKNQHSRHQAVQAYRRINKAAFDKVKPGGFVFTFSCSQAVGPELFDGAVAAAAIESGRNIRVIDHLNQPADHPQSIYHPEGLYLKGLVLSVE
ncbi:MAG: putative SAM-dependent methyltransferase [Bacteroidetes bacterium]|nr:putative SAM-dependent methyltransferase [Bacteroidota bacterium]